MPKVYTSTVIDAPADRVWSSVRDFNGLPGWHPGLRASRLENDGPPDRVGAVRALTLGDGGLVRETLLALSDYDLSYSYDILESPMGVEQYLATIKLTPVTDGDRCFIEWSAEFDCAPGREAELVELIGNGVFKAGLDALKERFGG